jgi:hypothetical protein
MSDPFSSLGSVNVNVGAVLGWATAVVTIASAVCAATPTPNPNTRIGKIYRVIETAALLVGRAKNTGLVPQQTPAQAALVAAATSVVAAAPAPAPPPPPAAAPPAT